VKNVKERTLLYYSTKNNEVPFVEWLKNLKDSSTQVRIRRRLDRIELGNFGDCASVGEGISELRLFFGSGYRIYFAEKNDEIIILLCGGDKSSQKKDIMLAKSYWRDLKERSDE
jgi:putative addiction module killer protein